MASAGYRGLCNRVWGVAGSTRSVIRSSWRSDPHRSRRCLWRDCQLGESRACGIGATNYVQGGSDKSISDHSLVVVGTFNLSRHIES